MYVNSIHVETCMCMCYMNVQCLLITSVVSWTSASRLSSWWPLSTSLLVPSTSTLTPLTTSSTYVYSIHMQMDGAYVDVAFIIQTEQVLVIAVHHDQMLGLHTHVHVGLLLQDLKTVWFKTSVTLRHLKFLRLYIAYNILVMLPMY